MNESVFVTRKNDEGKYVYKKVTDSKELKKIYSIADKAKSRNVEEIITEIIESNNSLVDRVTELERWRIGQEKMMTEICDRLSRHDEQIEDLEYIQSEWAKHQKWKNK